MPDNQENMIEIPPGETPAEEVDITATPEQGAEAGLTPEEVAMGKETGVIVEPEKPEAKPPESAPAAPAEKPPEQKPTEQKPEDDMRHADGSEYNQNEKGLYWEMKKDRRKRQEAEQQLRRTQLETKYYQDNYEKMQKELETVQNRIQTVEDGTREDLLTDEQKQQRDELRAKEKELKTKEEEQRKAQLTEQQKREQAEHASRILHESEMDFRNMHKDVDFDACCNLATDIFNSLNEKNPKRIFGDNEERIAYVSYVASKFLDNATRLSMGQSTDEELPELTFKLAQLHPQFNGKSQQTPNSNQQQPQQTQQQTNPPTGGTDVTNGKLDIMMRNADRRTSAVLSGGSSEGRRIVSEAELTWEDALKLPKDKFDKLKPETIDRLLMDSCK